MSTFKLMRRELPAAVYVANFAVLVIQALFGRKNDEGAP